jgi:hypothetical protein
LIFKTTIFTNLYIHIMAPSTPPKKPKRHEYDTIKCFHFLTRLIPSQKIREWEKSRVYLKSIYQLLPRRWIEERKRLGEEALRPTRKASSTLGRKPKVSAADLSRLTDQSNPEHELHYAEQVKLLPGKPSERTLRRLSGLEGTWHQYERDYDIRVLATRARRPHEVAND